MEVLKISSKSNPNSVAGAIAGLVKENNYAEMQAIGAGALNQAVKAVAIARGFVAPSGVDLVCVPAFAEVQVEGEETINLIPVLSSPSIFISVKAGIHTKFFPEGAIKPLAMAIAFIAWLSAPAPTAWISTLPFSLKTFANAPATLLGLDLDETFSVSIILSFLSI